MSISSFTENGFIIIDKPAGMSSARVVSRVKKITGARKVGHTGTLDPFATGLMICGINSGTRLSRFFLSCDKTYEAEMVLGIETDTMDCTGTVTAQCQDDFFSETNARLTLDYFTALLKRFEGTQQQLPPVYSALKHNGVPLYKLARQGKPVQKPARTITIYRAVLQQMKLPSLIFEISCSSGTYIRTIASDLGKMIGCGGHLARLRRTATGHFSIDDAVTLESLETSNSPSRYLISMDDALPDMPFFKVDTQLEDKIGNGVSLTANDGIVLEGDIEHDEEDIEFKLLNKKNQLIAIATYNKIKGNYNYCCVFKS